MFLSMKDSERTNVPMVGARQLSLMKQFAHAKFHVVGVQETRHKRQVSQSNPHYWVLGHTATDTGQGGIQIWWTKEHKIAAHARPFAQKDLSLVYADAQTVIANVRRPAFKATFFLLTQMDMSAAQQLSPLEITSPPLRIVLESASMTGCSNMASLHRQLSSNIKMDRPKLVFVQMAHRFATTIYVLRSSFATHLFDAGLSGPLT